MTSTSLKSVKLTFLPESGFLNIFLLHKVPPMSAAQTGKKIKERSNHSIVAILASATVMIEQDYYNNILLCPR